MVPVRHDSARPQLFLDCDGVLADFNGGVHNIFGMGSRETRETFGNTVFWRTLRAQPDFYGNLALLPDAMDLFRAVEHLHPIILTGCPVGGWAEPQKQAWAARYFPETRMITDLAREKSAYAKPGDILVDDYQKYRDLWEKAGGVFIHHTSVPETLASLKRFHLLDRD